MDLFLAAFPNAKWRGWKDRAVFAGVCLAIAVGLIVLVALWSCV